jgi:hypothetical protein
MSKSDSFPKSFVVEQLLETLERIENDAKRALSETQEMTQSDPVDGYARASGYSKGMFHSISTTARIYRELYTNA